MKHHSDILAGDNGWEISLVKMLGKPIADIRGYISDIGDGKCFKLSSVHFEDGSSLWVEGEHDFPYLVESPTLPEYNEEYLEQLYNEANGEE